MLSEFNFFEKGNEMLRGEQSALDKSKIKALYIEGMINFLEIYGQSEIGEVEINIPAVALYVNSPEFENVDCYMIKDIEDVYKCLEIEILMGLPIWRFLKLSEYQMNIFEKNYEQTLIENQKYLEENYPCKRCIYFRELNTSLGYLTECNNVKDDWISNRDKHIDWTKITECQNCITIDEDLSDLKEKSFRQWRNAISCQESYKRKLENRDISKIDNYKITLKDLKEDCVMLDSLNKVNDKTDFILEGFKDAFNNKRSKSERILELKKALYLEGFIKFIDLFAKNELGNDYSVNISEVVVYLEDKDLEFKSEEELFLELENLVLEGFEIKKFIRKVE